MWWSRCGFTSAEQRAMITSLDLLAPKTSEGHLLEPVLGVGSLLAVVVLLEWERALTVSGCAPFGWERSVPRRECNSTWSWRSV